MIRVVFPISLLALAAGCVSPTALEAETAKAEEVSEVTMETSGELWAWRQEGSSRAGRIYFNVRDDAAVFVRKFRGRSDPPPVGPIPIRAAIGESSWNASLYDASSFNGFLLEVPKSVTAQEKLSDGSKVTVRLSTRPDSE